MRRKRLSRPELYKKICQRMGLSNGDDDRMVGYFSTRQLRLVWEYIELTDKQIEEKNDSTRSTPRI